MDRTSRVIVGFLVATVGGAALAFLAATFYFIFIFPLTGPDPDAVMEFMPGMAWFGGVAWGLAILLGGVFALRGRGTSLA